jgi:hypothetical protein
VLGSVDDVKHLLNKNTQNILGSGLGLSIVKKIAHLYDGEVSVKSQPNVGSTFTPAAESHGLWPWMNARTFGRDVAPHGR